VIGEGTLSGADIQFRMDVKWIAGQWLTKLLLGPEKLSHGRPYREAGYACTGTVGWYNITKPPAWAGTLDRVVQNRGLFCVVF
jgi:hypothetical protein